MKLNIMKNTMNENSGKERWKDLGFKDKLAYGTCIVTFILGWSITYIGFVVSPLGEVSDGVLWILGQSLVYCASVLGISMYITKSFRNIKTELGLKHE